MFFEAEEIPHLRRSRQRRPQADGVCLEQRFFRSPIHEGPSPIQRAGTAFDQREHAYEDVSGLVQKLCGSLDVENLMMLYERPQSVGFLVGRSESDQSHAQGVYGLAPGIGRLAGLGE